MRNENINYYLLPKDFGIIFTFNAVKKSTLLQNN